jgi:hypothetical protein
MRVNMYPEVMTREVTTVAMAHGHTLSIMRFWNRRMAASVRRPAAVGAQRSQANGAAYGMGIGVTLESCCASGSGSYPL